MIARMERFVRLRNEPTENSMHEEVRNWVRKGCIRAAISTASGSTNTVNELLRIDSTHTALTACHVETGERLQDKNGTVYDVSYVIYGARRRLNQLFLKAVKAP